jgi:hypothetical protein
MYMLFQVSIIPLATVLGIFQASDQDFASCMRSEQSRAEIEFRPNEVELRVQRRDAPISTPYKLDRSPSMSHHPHGDVDQHAIKIMFEGLRRGRQAGIELSTTIGEISRGILSTKIPGETFNHATGRALAATRQKAEGSSKSPDELARSVLFAQAVFETRFAVASEDPTRPGTPDLGELRFAGRFGSGLSSGYRGAPWPRHRDG